MENVLNRSNIKLINNNPFLKEYIDLNTDLRKQSKND